LKAHKRPEAQNLFPIVQGGLDPKLRTESAKQLMERDVAGFAIGGLRYIKGILLFENSTDRIF